MSPERSGLVSMHKRMCSRHVGDIARRAHDGMHEARGSINADCAFFPKCQVIALLRLVHLRVTLAILVLRRLRRGDQRGVNNSSLPHHQTFFGEVSVDCIEDLALQFICFEQVAKLEQHRRVRRRLPAQIDANENTNGLAVVDPIFNAFVRSTKALLGHVHAQHAGQTDRRTTRAFDLRIERLDQFMQPAPRSDAVDLSEETVTPRDLLLGGVLEVGEALLHGRWRAGNMALLSQVRRGRKRELLNQSVPPYLKLPVPSLFFELKLGLCFTCNGRRCFAGNVFFTSHACSRKICLIPVWKFCNVVQRAFEITYL
jgi:hypothetical protein